MKNRTWTRNSRAVGRASTARFVELLLVGLIAITVSSTTSASPREQAKRIHDRLAGIPPSETVLQQMEADVDLVQPGTPGDGLL